ncbi:hypothetical protein ACQP04_35670 [Pseudonocardia halophobica]|uniref:hypothetical protein n=1 Tax=Pseudonocardia halophobica TaxID=29401 RepID=UPI003D8A29A2
MPRTLAVASYELGLSLLQDGNTDDAAIAFADAIQAEVGALRPGILQPAVEATVALLLSRLLYAEGGGNAAAELALNSVSTEMFGAHVASTAHLGLAIASLGRLGAAAWHLGEAARLRKVGMPTLGERLVHVAFRRQADMPAPDAKQLALALRREGRPAELAWTLTILASDRLAEGNLLEALAIAVEAVGTASTVNDPHGGKLLARAQYLLDMVNRVLDK